MTGGRVVVLGKTGRNFAAGMSGGVAFVLDPHDQLNGNLNHEMVELEDMSNVEDVAELKDMISKHANYTGSKIAKSILEDWSNMFPKFKKVIPVKYREILRQRAASAAEAAKA
jgi:glutamate synthase domain-containing protein 3